MDTQGSWKEQNITGTDWNMRLYRDENDNKKETLMIGVQKKLMVMWNKISDKNWCAEKADGNEEQKKS